MTDQERVTYWYKRAKAAEEQAAVAWEEGAEYGFSKSDEGYNGGFFPDAAPRIDWRKENPLRKKGA